MGDEDLPTLEKCLSGDEHHWKVKGVALEGRGSMSSYTTEQCSKCGGIRINYDVDFLGAVE